MIIFKWDSMLGAVDVFTDHSIECEVETMVGDSMLSRRGFILTSDSVDFLGERDEGSDMALEGGISVSTQLSIGTELPTAVTYRLHFHPTQEFYDVHHTWIPVWACVVCNAITLSMAVLFLIYDWLVKRESVENKMLLDSKRVFVRFVSHEIRTPINTITLGLQLLEARLQSLDSCLLYDGGGDTDVSPSCSVRHETTVSAAKQIQYDEYNSPMSKAIHNERNSLRNSVPTSRETVDECLDLVGELAESSKTAVVVLNELINYDKIEMEKFEVERQLCDICSVLESTFRPLEVQAKQRDVRLTLHQDHAIKGPLFVIGDSMKLGQVIRYVLQVVYFCFMSAVLFCHALLCSVVCCLLSVIYWL